MSPQHPDFLDPERGDPNVGDRDQWVRVRAAANSHDRHERHRAEVAAREAAMFGTDPSWFGF